MAINFPDSPSLNQEFQAGDRVWFWNGTVWKAQETAVLETGKYIVSDTAPPFPTEGDAWFDSVRTKEFIYYDGFWVETSAAAVGIPGLSETDIALASNITLEAGYRYFIDTTASRTITLPLSPSLGDEVIIFDANNLAATNNVIVSNNGEKIDGIAEGIIVDVNAFVISFIYTGSTYGWRMI